MEWFIFSGIVAAGLAYVFIQVAYWLWKVRQIERTRVAPIEVWQEFAAQLDEPDRTQMFALIHQGRYPLGAVIRMAYWARDRNKPAVAAPVRYPAGKSIKPGVYLLHCQGRYKIGMSTTGVRSRVSAIQTASPYPVELVCVIWTYSPAELERALHKRFASKRISGEWFDLSADDVDYLKEAARNPAALAAEEVR